MTPDEAGRIVLDDLGVRRALTDYAAMVDARDFEALTDVFAPGAVVDYHNGRTTVRGAQAIVDYIRDNTAHLAWQHHNVSVYGVDLRGDDATAQAYLLSHQMHAADPGYVQMMAARYRCTMRRGAERWQIAHMVHTIQLTNFLPVSAQHPNAAPIPPAVAP